jgi:hypothetical protein
MRRRALYKKKGESEPLDITQSTFSQETATAISPALIDGLRVLDNGTKLFYTSKFARKVYRHDFGTPYDITTLTYVQETPQLDYNMVGMFISPDGMNLYTTNPNKSRLLRHSLTTAWDISTATLIHTEILVGFYSFCFSVDGMKFYGLTGGDVIKQYSLSTAWDISTMTFEKEPLSFLGITGGLSITNDGKCIFLRYGDNVYQINLNVPYDTDTANSTIPANFTDIESISVAAENRKLYIADVNTEKIEEYNF